MVCLGAECQVAAVDFYSFQFSVNEEVLLNMTGHNIPGLIMKKRDGHALDDAEIDFFIDAIVNAKIDESQIGAMLMAIRCRGMTDEETAQLTRSMTNSGFKFEWPEEWRHLVVDKHSTGGVGDKVTIVLTPALAACGLKVPTITGRGLSHTGGTLDKLESIPGFFCYLTADEIFNVVSDIGCCIVGQTNNIAPADKTLYKTRDVTGTVDSIPLITGSILSKKIAESPAALVIDVKLGKGAVMRDEQMMRKLANSLVSVANLQGVKTTALLTRMDTSLGNMVGNALEIAEVIECLRGVGPTPLVNLIQSLGGYLLYNVGRAVSPSEGAKAIAGVLKDGQAMEKFKATLKAQRVSESTVEALCATGADVFDVLPRAAHKTPVVALNSGFVLEIDSKVCADVCMNIGAGRLNVNDIIDFAAGIETLRPVGEYVNAGDHVLLVHHNRPLADDDLTKLQNAILVGASRPDAGFIDDLVIDVITG